MRKKPPEGETATVLQAQSSMEVRTETDLFNHRYYRLNKLLLETIGAWPFQSTRARIVILSAIYFLTFSQMIPQIMIIEKNNWNWDILMKCAPALIFGVSCANKLILSVFNLRKMLTLLNHIRMDWEVSAHDNDVDILHRYAEKGRRLTVAYTAVGYTTCVIFVTQPVVSKIVDVLLKNDTEPGQFPIPVDYYHVDMQKYYFLIMLHCFFYASLGYVVSIAYGSMFVVYVQHGCALFAIVGRQLDRIGKNEISTGRIACELRKPITAFEHVASCIEKHNHAIEYAKLVDATYSLCFLFNVASHIILLSLNGIETITRSNDPKDAMRFICSIVLTMVILYIDSFMSQMIIDHSISVLNHIFHGKWYSLPPKTQNLLLLMMMRCNVPCKLTAAKIAIMSMESYGVILKTALSYFTVLRSV